MPLSLVFANNDFVVLDKPAGLSFHSEAGAGVVALAAEQLQCALYPVHRLDKGTSGLLLLAKSSAVAAELSAQFASHQVQKYYLALSFSKPKQKQGWVKGDMQPSRNGCYKLVSSQTNPAVSYFFSAGLVAEGLPERARLFLVRPWTGKTHQIRVALKSMAAAIAGDERYGGAEADRLYLHAYALSFTLQGQPYQFLQAPSTGRWFCHSAVEAQLQQAWAQPHSLEWPYYQWPKQES